MDNQAPQSGFELPVPNTLHHERVLQPVSPDVGAHASPEIMHASHSTQTPQVAQPQAPPVLPAQPVVSNMPLPPPPISQHHTMTADDVDLIEKEWVNKAKEIIARTSQDPYQQNKAINAFKADYIKARYHRDVPVSDR